MRQYYDALFLLYRPRTECGISQFCNTNCTHSIFRTIDRSIKILIVRYKTQHISYEFKKKKTCACDHLKTSNLSADNFKKVLDLDGSTPEPAIRSGDTGQRIPCFDSCQLITTLMSNGCVHYQFSCALKLARKYEIEH